MNRWIALSDGSASTFAFPRIDWSDRDSLRFYLWLLRLEYVSSLVIPTWATPISVWNQASTSFSSTQPTICFWFAIMKVFMLLLLEMPIECAAHFVCVFDKNVQYMKVNHSHNLKCFVRMQQCLTRFYHDKKRVCLEPCSDVPSFPLISNPANSKHDQKTPQKNWWKKWSKKV